MTTLVTSWVDVVDQGADPTGLTDSTVAINTAISLLTPERNVLYFMPGTYSIGNPAPDEQQYLSALIPGATVLGCGVGVTTIESTNAGYPIITTYTTATPASPIYASNTIKGLTVKPGYPI
jgi:hypothetical protein